MRPIDGATDTPCRAVAVVPVRIGSDRLPGKAMLRETGRPLFLHTWERAMLATRFDAVYVATDSADVALAAEEAGVRVIRTSDRPRTGSERCAEALAAIGDRVDIVVDIQGDWPEVAPQDLDALVECLAEDPARRSATLAAPLRDMARAADPNVVKVVRGLGGAALYFSRAPIPYRREGHGDDAALLRHVGVYGFTAETLLAIPDLPSSGLDRAEGLEQLRFLENAIPMQVLDATGEPWGIETRDDYDAFLARAAQGEKTP